MPITSPAEAYDFILDQWWKSGLLLPDELLAKLLYCRESYHAMPDDLVEHISQVAACHTAIESPAWLNEIDDYFSQEASPDFPTRACKSSQCAHAFVDILYLLYPLVSIGTIVRMRSFTDDFVGRMEMPLYRLDMPRDVAQARELYSAILDMPRRYVRYTIDGELVSDQAFKAQMLLALMLSRLDERGSDLWLFQKEVLETCPDYLLDVPGIGMDSTTSYRPAFWFAHGVSDPHFRSILLKRGSEEVRRNFEPVLKYERQREAARSELESDDRSTSLPLSRRVPSSQAGLVTVLEELNSHLAQNIPVLHEKLRSGVNDDQIDKLNVLLNPLRIPENLATFYKWHNGIEYDGFLLGFPEFRSLQDTLQDYRSSVEDLGGVAWCSAWFPVGYSNRTYRIVSLAQTQEVSSGVYVYDVEDGTLHLAHESIEAMMRCYLEAYRTGAIAKDPVHGDWEIQDEAFDAIRYRLSPTASRYPDRMDSAVEVYDLSTWPPLWRNYALGEHLEDD